MYLPSIPVLIYILFFVEISGGSVFVGGTIGLIALHIFINTSNAIKAFNKRNIVLSNQSIKFLHEGRVLEEIKLDEITDIKRTFSSLYHKSQVVSDIIKGILIIVFPFVCILWFLPLIIVKFCFHLFKKGSRYRFFDAVMIFNKERFINILPATEDEYEELRDYFMTKKRLFDIEQAKIFWEDFGHYEENIK
jgi:hypothetical protein